MSRRNDRSIQFAFGDADDKSAARLKRDAEQDAELQNELRQMEQLKCSLNLLKDIPEHQMSTERLRDAILKQGLKPNSSPARRWGSSWAVIGIAALAGLVFAFPKTQVTPASAVKPLVKPTNSALVASRETHGIAPVNVVNNTAPAPSNSGHAHQVAHSKLEPKTSYIDVRPLLSRAVEETVPWGNQVERTGRKLADAPVHNGGRTLLSIDGDDDAATGLPKAKEVADASHVVISS